MDIESFLTGFLQSRGEAIKEQKSEAKDEENRLRQLAMANASKVQQRKVVYDSATKMTQDLLKLGVPKDTVKAAVGSGKLDAVWKDVTAIQTQMGDEGVTKFLDTNPFSADLGTAEYSTIQEALATAYGMPQTGAKGDYKAPKVGPLGRLFGQGDYEKERLAKLDEEQSLVEGMSTYDLANIGVLPTYIPGSQGESFAYTSPILYNNDTRDAAITRMQKSLELIGKNEELTKLSSDIKEFSTQLAEKGAKSDAIQSDDIYINLQNRLNTAKMAYANKFKEVGGDLLITEAERFFNSSAYYSDLAGLVKAYVPGAEAAGLVEALMEQSLTSKDEEDIVEEIESAAPTAAPTVDPTVDPAVDPTVAPTPTQTKAPTPTPAASPVVETGKTPSGVDFTKAEDGTISIDGKPLSEEDQAEFLEAMKEEGLSLSRLDGKDESGLFSLENYKDIYNSIEGLEGEELENHMKTLDELENIEDYTGLIDDIKDAIPTLPDVVKGLDQAAAIYMGYPVWVWGALQEFGGKANIATIGNVKRGLEKITKGKNAQEAVKDFATQGLFTTIYNQIPEDRAELKDKLVDVAEKLGAFFEPSLSEIPQATPEQQSRAEALKESYTQSRLEDEPEVEAQEVEAQETYSLGRGEPVQLSAEQRRGFDAPASQQLRDVLNTRSELTPGYNVPGESTTYEIDPEAATRSGLMFSPEEISTFSNRVDADAVADAETATQKRIEAYDRQFLADARNFALPSEGPSTGKRVAGIMSEAYADMGDKAEAAIIRLDRNAAKGVRNLHDQLTTALGNQVAREANHLSKAFSWSGEPNKKTVEQQASMWADFKKGLVNTYQDMMKSMSQEELQAMLPEQLSSIIDVLNPTANLEPTKFVKVAQNIADQHGADSSTAKKANKLLNRLEENKPIAKNDVVALIIDTMKLPVEEDRQLLLNNLYSIYNAVSGE